MDFAKATLLIGSVLGLVALVKAVIWGDKKQRTTVLIVAASAAVGVFLVAASTWGSQNVIGDVAMNKMSVWDKLVVVIFVAGGSALGWETLGALKNIGQNQLTDTQKAALDAGAAKLVEGTLAPNAGGQHPGGAEDVSAAKVKEAGG